jgi:hypothetical protein
MPQERIALNERDPTMLGFVPPPSMRMTMALYIEIRFSPPSPPGG